MQNYQLKPDEAIGIDYPYTSNQLGAFLSSANSVSFPFTGYSNSVTSDLDSYIVDASKSGTYQISVLPDLAVYSRTLFEEVAISAVLYEIVVTTISIDKSGSTSTVYSLRTIGALDTKEDTLAKGIANINGWNPGLLDFQELTLQSSGATHLGRTGTNVVDEFRTGLYLLTVYGNAIDFNLLTGTLTNQTQAGRYLLTLGNPTGQRASVWSDSWIDVISSLPVINSNNPVSNWTQNTDLKVIPKTIPTELQYSVPAWGTGSQMASASFVYSDGSYVNDSYQLVAAGKDKFVDVADSIAFPAVVEVLKNHFSNSLFASTLIGTMNQLKDSVQFYTDFKKNINALIDVVTDGIQNFGTLDQATYEARSSTALNQFSGWLRDTLILKVGGDITGKAFEGLSVGLSETHSYAMSFSADDLSGSDKRDILVGGSGNNKLSGGAGNDVLYGGSGNDILTGGTGDDTLTGGSGNDIFVFDKSGNGQDKITDLQVGDLIRVTGAAFSGAISSGNGNGLNANQVRFSTTNDVTTLYIGTDNTTGADITIDLTGSYLANQFKLSGTDISLVAVTAPVYRFAKISTGAYFYTGYESEKNSIIQNYPDFRFEGVTFQHILSDYQHEVFRFANLNNGGYFYTANLAEKDSVLQNYPNMRYEGSSFSVAADGAPGTDPVYRLANLKNGAYLYTTYLSEKNAAIGLGYWRDEGIAFWSPQPTGTVSKAAIGDTIGLDLAIDSSADVVGLMGISSDHDLWLV